MDRFIGQATVELSDGESRVLTDPFLAPNNPAATLTAEDVEPTHILRLNRRPHPRS